MSIQYTVDVSGNERWNVNLADFLSRDIKCNKCCHTGKLSQSINAFHERSIAQLKSVLALCNLFQTEVGSEKSDRKGHMFKLMSKYIISDEVR